MKPVVLLFCFPSLDWCSSFFFDRSRVGFCSSRIICSVNTDCPDTTIKANKGENFRLGVSVGNYRFTRYEKCANSNRGNTNDTLLMALFTSNIVSLKEMDGFLIGIIQSALLIYYICLIIRLNTARATVIMQI